jgi:hypothetical protein
MNFALLLTKRLKFILSKYLLISASAQATLIYAINLHDRQVFICIECEKGHKQAVQYSMEATDQAGLVAEAALLLAEAVRDDGIYCRNCPPNVMLSVVAVYPSKGLSKDIWSQFGFDPSYS